MEKPFPQWLVDAQNLGITQVILLINQIGPLSKKEVLELRDLLWRKQREVSKHFDY